MLDISLEGGLEEVDKAGTYWVRHNSLYWPDIEPEEGKRTWDEDLEKQLIAAHDRNLQVILIVRGTPEWAQKVDGSVCGPIKQEKFEAFASFLKDAVVRYSQSPYFVNYWEICNEPDAPISDHTWPFGCWGDKNDSYFGGGYYAEMLKLAYQAVKSAAPQAIVLLGGLLLDCDPINPPEYPPGSGEYKDCTSSKFLEGVLLNGGGDYFDIVSFHAYDYYGSALGKFGNPNWHSAWNTTGPSLIAKANYLLSVLSAYGYSDKPLINTENSLLCYAGCNKKFEATKAFYLAEAYASLQAMGLSGNIWYDVYGGWLDSGLLYKNDKPRPAYGALITAHERFAHANYTRPIGDGVEITGYEFEQGDRRVWVLWSQNGATHIVTLPSKPDAMWDAVGNFLTPVTTLSLDIVPTYIEWDS